MIVTKKWLITPFLRFLGGNGMNCYTKRFLALVLAAAMMLSLSACAAQPYRESDPQLSYEETVATTQPNEEKDGTQPPVQTQPVQIPQQPQGTVAVPTQPLPVEADRESLEQIVHILGNSGTDASMLDDEALNDLVQDLVEKLEKEEPKAPSGNTTVELPKTEEIYDEDTGALAIPFDQAYPELVASQQVAYDDQTLLIKMSNSRGGQLTEGMKAAGVAALEPVLPMEKATWYEAKLCLGMDVGGAVAALRSLKEIQLVDYNYQLQTAQLDSYKELPKDFSDNDRAGEQWHMHHCGIPSGMETMKTDGGDSGVVVAVIDSGVDYDHEDLLENMWVNRGEVPDDGIDNDGNGYIDDYYGVNIVAGKGNGDDDNGHGTHVAGIIAARNNGVGVVGLAYNVKIMSIKASSSAGILNQADIAKAVQYAYSMGADVINMSFGGTACSIAVQDALSVAYTRCVLVASAGNDGAPNEGNNITPPIPNYPAALSYVLGVMSVDANGVESNFTNFDVKGFNGIEYELYAPGETMMSTLPGDRYGSLSGTSMAAPVVAAMAAILRSEYGDRDTYPTRFIYGQLSATSEYQATCLNPAAHGRHNLPKIVDLHAALTKLPNPMVGMQEYALFDTKGLENDSGSNNGDGVIDAGETIALGLTLRNRWGASKNSVVTIDAISNGVADPYVTILNPTVDYGAIGTYAEGNCGGIYTDELLTGWENPFYIQISKDCPNDYWLQLNVTVTSTNGLDEADTETYTVTDEIILNVRSGYVLPSVIDEDMVLTADNLYIIPNSTVINKGVTVRVEPGTRIQFWSADAEDPYADSYIAYLLVNGSFICEGTREEPIYIYPSELMSDYVIEIAEGANGHVSFTWCDITNWCFLDSYQSSNTGKENAISLADHCTFRFNFGTGLNVRRLSGTTVSSNYASSLMLGRIYKAVDCVFYKIAAVNDANSGSVSLVANMERCIFADCGLTFFKNSDYSTMQNCVFLGNSYNDQTKPDIWSSSQLKITGGNSIGTYNINLYYHDICGTTYLNYSGGLPAEYLAYAGGHELIIETADELQWITNKADSYAYILLSTFYDAESSCYRWSDGTQIDTQLLAAALTQEGAEPAKKLMLYNNEIVEDIGVYYNSYPRYWYEFPGDILPTDIRFNSYEVSLDMGVSYAIHPITDPAPMEVNEFLYESTDEAVVTVDENGIVTPVGLGSADVKVHSKDKAVWNYITFHVKEEVALENIGLSISNSILSPGDALTLDVILTPVDTTRNQIVYTSDNEAAATVSAAGVVTAIAPGTATITATCEGLTASVTVEVGNAATSLEFANIAVRYTLTEEAPQLPKLNVSEGAHTVLVWQSSDGNVADIVDGALVLKDTGVTQLTVTDLRSGLSDTVTVYVQSEDVQVQSFGQNNNHYYALLSDGSLYSWGGASGTPSFVCTGVTCADAYMPTYGTYTRCCLVARTDGTVEVWENGKLAETWTDFVGQQIVQVSLGDTEDNRYVLLADGSVYAWGTSNSYGQLGSGTTEAVSEPSRISLDAKVVKMVAGTQTALLTENGNLYVLGNYDEKLLAPTLIARNVTDIFDDCYIAEGMLCFYSGATKNGQIMVVSGYTCLDIYGGWNTNSCYGIGYKNGMLYTLTINVSYTDGKISSCNAYEEPYMAVPNVTAVEKSYDYYDTSYYFIADGMLYGFNLQNQGGLHREGVSVDQTETPGVIWLPALTDTLTLTGSNISSEGQLTGDALELTFNKPMRAVTVTLHEDGVALSASATITGNRVSISNTLGFAEGCSYDVVISAAGTAGIHKTAMTEDVTLVFTWKAEEEAAEQTKVIHEAELDDTVVRGWTKDNMYTALLEAQKAIQYNSGFRGNAILNRITTDTDVTHWMRPIPTTTNGTSAAAGGNYWGTVNENAIELQIVDYADVVSYGRIEYKPYLTTAPENTYPFVTGVAVLNKAGEKVTTVGNEEMTVRITFNRDMDTSYPLNVRFGSAYPYADYEVTGSYVDARTWEGKYFVSTVIGNGDQFFTIGNGWSATEDLALQTDVARFMFHIDTTAAQALLMQGQATETGIRLSWTQDDFDTLMGYHVYRSTSEDGFYQRINTTVIPAETMEFFDDTVEPGQLYYYNFTVVKTDMTESAPSGKISLYSLDTMAPDIYHTPVYTGYAGESLVVSATITDNMHISYAKLYYRTTGVEGWNEALMNNLNDKFSAIIPANHVTLEGIEYYIEAFDGISYTYKGSADAPYQVQVQYVAEASSMGDVNGDGKISNLDALMLLQAINDLLNLDDQQFIRADLDGSGELTASEALRILQYVSGAVSSVVMA